MQLPTIDPALDLCTCAGWVAQSTEECEAVEWIGLRVEPKKSAKGYHGEGLFKLYIIGKLNISRFIIQLIAVSNFQQSAHPNTFSKMADIC